VSPTWFPPRIESGRLRFQALPQFAQRTPWPPRLVADDMPAHKKAVVKTYVVQTKGKQTPHFPPGFAGPESGQIGLEACERTGHCPRTAAEGGESAGVNTGSAWPKSARTNHCALF